MSLLGIARGAGRHRHLSRAELAQRLALVERQKDAATVAAIRYATAATELQQQLDQAGITISGLLLDLEGEREEGSLLRAELANATAVSTRPVRDIWPGCEDTQPIRVLPLWEAIPGSTDPAHIPGPLAG